MATHELNTQYYPRPQTPQPQPAATPTDEIYIPAPAPPWRRRLSRRALLLGVLLTVLLASLTAVAGGGVLLYYSNLIAPGAQVLGNDVGGQTQAAATEAIAAQWQRQSITLASGETTWLVHPSALGITLDAAATARSAHA